MLQEYCGLSQEEICIEVEWKSVQSGLASTCEIQSAAMHNTKIKTH